MAQQVLDDVIKIRITSEFSRQLAAIAERTGKSQSEVSRELMEASIYGSQRPRKRESDIPVKEAVLCQIDGLNSLLELVAARNPKEATLLATDTGIAFQRWADRTAESIGTTAEALFIERESRE